MLRYSGTWTGAFGVHKEGGGGLPQICEALIKESMVPMTFTAERGSTSAEIIRERGLAQGRRTSVLLATWCILDTLRPADYAGFTHGAIQRADGGLGQDRGGAHIEDDMEHGSNHGAPAETIYGNGGGVLQGSVEKDEKYAIRGKGLDADDQANMDELRGPRAAREQRTHDLGGEFVAELGRENKVEAGRQTSRSSKRTDTLVGRGAGKNARRARRERIDAGSSRGPKHVERKGGALCSSGSGDETWEAAGGVKMRTRESLHEKRVHATRGRGRGTEGRKRIETGSTGAPGENVTGDNEGVKDNGRGIRTACAANAMENAQRSEFWL